LGIVPTSAFLTTQAAVLIQLFVAVIEVEMETPGLTDAGASRMRVSMDVVDAERLQGNGFAIVGLKKKNVLFSESTNIILYRESVSLTVSKP
jgi:hypothetical protein